MKRITYIILFLALNVALVAQEGTPTTPPSTGIMAGTNCIMNLAAIYSANCNLIWFCYDASGNRIARFVPYCISTGGGGGGFGNHAMAAPINDKVLDTNVTIALVEATILFPNPTMGVTQMTFPKVIQNATLLLLDMNGKILETKNFSGKEISIDLTQYPGGTYYLAVTTDAANIRKAIVKH